MQMKNGTERLRPTVAWENYYPTPPQPTTGSNNSEHLQPQSHAKYKAIVVVHSPFYSCVGKTSWCNVICSLLKLIAAQENAADMDQTLWSLLGNSFNSYQITPPQLPSSSSDPRQFPGSAHKIQWDKLMFFKKGSCPIFSLVKLQLSHSLLLWRTNANISKSVKQQLDRK